MKTLTAREIIKREYGTSKNFMTPYIIKYGKITRDMAYELSEGIGLHGNLIYGVTVVEIDNVKTKRMDNVSNWFGSEMEALQYINQLKKEYKTIY